MVFVQPLLALKIASVDLTLMALATKEFVIKLPKFVKHAPEPQIQKLGLQQVIVQIKITVF